MRFKKTVKIEAGLQQIDIAPLINVIFLLLIFFMLSSSFVVMPGINVKLPQVLSSDEINRNSLTVVVSSDDAIYFAGKPIPLPELEKMINSRKFRSVFIRADRKASLDVIVGIWDICKKSGIEKIGIATTYND